MCMERSQVGIQDLLTLLNKLGQFCNSQKHILDIVGFNQRVHVNFDFLDILVEFLE